MANNEDLKADIPDLKEKENERKKAGAAWSGAKPGGGAFSGARAAASAGGASGGPGGFSAYLAGLRAGFSSFFTSLTSTVMGKAVLAAAAASFLLAAGVVGYSLFGGEGSGGLRSIDLGSISSAMKIRPGGGDRTGYVASNGEIAFDPAKAESAEAGAADEAGAGDTGIPQAFPGAGEGDLGGAGMPGGRVFDGRRSELNTGSALSKLSSSFGGGNFGGGFGGGGNMAKLSGPTGRAVNESGSSPSARGGARSRAAGRMGRSTGMGRQMAKGTGRQLGASSGGQLGKFATSVNSGLVETSPGSKITAPEALGQLIGGAGVSQQAAKAPNSQAAAGMAGAPFTGGQNGGTIPDKEPKEGGNPDCLLENCIDSIDPGKESAPDEAAKRLAEAGTVGKDTKTEKSLKDITDSLTTLAKMVRDVRDAKNRGKWLQLIGLGAVALGLVFLLFPGLALPGIVLMSVGLGMILSARLAAKDYVKKTEEHIAQMQKDIVERTEDVYAKEVIGYCMEQAHKGVDPKDCNPPREEIAKRIAAADSASTAAKGGDSSSTPAAGGKPVPTPTPTRTPTPTPRTAGFGASQDEDKAIHDERYQKQSEAKVNGQAIKAPAPRAAAATKDGGTINTDIQQYCRDNPTASMCR